MTKFEFTESLRKALSGRVNYTVVNDNVAYYEAYIDTEVKKGRNEREVLEELGDPRLIAKTIIEAEKAGGAASDIPQEGEPGRRFGGRVLHIPSWLFLIILLLIVVVVLHVVGIVLSALLPIAVPVCLIVFLIRYFRRR
ncbi:MAG: DUF1700 domain-containing protein [Lachnospiraceae bacterium]|nr:DUF1700 domain-containing protein [Lachnospiraceae bacterium]